MNRHAPTRHALLLCGVLCLPALTGCGTEIAKQAQVQNTLAVAQQQAQIGRTPEARKWADRAIAIAPGDINTYIAASAPDAPIPLLGVVGVGSGEQGVFTSVGDDADTVFYMAKAIAKFPNNPLPLLVMAQAQGRLGHIAEQQATAAKAAAAIEHELTVPGHKVSADIIITLAQAYWDAGDAVKGTTQYRNVIATYPHDESVADAYNGLAYNYAVVNDKSHLAEALSLAQTALRLVSQMNPKDREKSTGLFQDTLGWIQYRQGNYKDALTNVQKCIDINPRLAECRYHLAMVYKALGDTDAARIELGYAVKLSQGYAAAQSELEKLPPPPKEASSLAPSPPRRPALPAAAGGPRRG